MDSGSQCPTGFLLAIGSFDGVRGQLGGWGLAGYTSSQLGVCRANGGVRGPAEGLQGQLRGLGVQVSGLQAS